MFTSKTFWADAGERAVKTAAQALLAVLVLGTTIYSIDWGEAVGVAALAALVSLVTSIADPNVGAEKPQGDWGRIDGED